MNLVPSAEEEVKRIRAYAALFDEDRSADDAERSAIDKQYREYFGRRSSEIEAAKEDGLLKAILCGQPYLDGAHIDLLEAWDEVVQAARHTKPPVPSEKLCLPLITVAPTGRFSAVSVRDVGGNTALVFDSSLLAALYMVALHCGRAFFDWIEAYVHNDMERFAHGVVDVRGIPELHEILSSVVAHGFVAPDVALECARRADARSWLTGPKLYARLLQFLAGHEFSHFLYDHHLFDAGKAEPLASPLFGLLRESLERRTSSYADQLAEPGDMQICNFLFHQFHEFQADEQSASFLAVSGGYDNENPMKRRLFVIDLAAIAMYFMVSAAIERMVFIRIRGRDPASSPMYADYGVFNLCVRESHPSPISRLAWIKEWINVNLVHGAEAADFFLDPVAFYFDCAVGLDRGMRKYVPLHPQLVAKKWSSRYSLEGLLSVLWPGADVPNLGDWLLQQDKQPPSGTT